MYGYSGASPRLVNEGDPEAEMCFHEIADTIVVPTFSKIEDD